MHSPSCDTVQGCMLVTVDRCVDGIIENEVHRKQSKHDKCDQSEDGEEELGETMTLSLTTCI